MPGLQAAPRRLMCVSKLAVRRPTLPAISVSSCPYHGAARVS